jgi:hypothetical protein
VTRSSNQRRKPIGPEAFHVEYSQSLRIISF